MRLLHFILLTIFLSFLSLHANSLRIEAIDLSKNINKYKILDTRSSEEYAKGHIDTSLNFPIDLTYDNKKINGKVIQPAIAQKIIRDLGLNVNDAIVIYDDGTFYDASRLFWTLEVYGFTNIKLLNTGYEQWNRYGFTTSIKSPTPQRSNYIASINNKRLATKLTTQIAVKNPNYTILDARPDKAYKGEVSMAKRFGHIPKALSFPVYDNIDSSGTLNKLKRLKDLKNLYSEINKDKKIIVYCAIGRIASTNYFVLRELGYDVSNYDSSWREWGNDFNLPIEK